MPQGRYHNTFLVFFYQKKRKIAIWMSKNCQKLDFFLNDKNCHLKKKLPLPIFRRVRYRSNSCTNKYEYLSSTHILEQQNQSSTIFVSLSNWFYFKDLFGVGLIEFQLIYLCVFMTLVYQTIWYNVIFNISIWKKKVIEMIEKFTILMTGCRFENNGFLKIFNLCLTITFLKPEHKYQY